MTPNDYNVTILKLHNKGLNYSEIADTLIEMHGLEDSQHRNLRRHASKVVNENLQTNLTFGIENRKSRQMECRY